MATTYSPRAAAEPVPDRRRARRQQTVADAMDHAVAIMAERGVGALTISEVARRMGMRGPSLYKYFPSLHALYDALFARGLRAHQEAVYAAVGAAEPGVGRLRAGPRASVAWCVANPALAQLLFWRPVPDFAPSPGTFQLSVAEMADVAAELAEAVRRGELAPRATEPDAVRLLTVVISGVVSQQMANEPGADFATGSFSRLIDEAVLMFLDHYRPEGGSRADS